MIASALVFRLRAPKSEAFGYIRATVLRSKSIEAMVGEVSDVKPDFMGTYRAKYSIPGLESYVNQFVVMDVNVTGKRGRIPLRIEADKKNGIWKIAEATTSNGAKVNLDE